MGDIKEVEVHDYFTCLKSLDMMEDPIVFSMGITYDHHMIQGWMNLHSSYTTTLNSLSPSRSCVTMKN